MSSANQKAETESCLFYEKHYKNKKYGELASALDCHCPRGLHVTDSQELDGVGCHHLEDCTLANRPSTSAWSVEILGWVTYLGLSQGQPVV